MKIIEKRLFETKAIDVARQDSAFWYTSGKIGPYFINTHYLFGSCQAAQSLLDFITRQIEQPLHLIEQLTKRVTSFYHSNELYHEIIDFFVDQIKDQPEVTKSDYISGGERRDWFFSIILAKLLNKPHLYIFKNLEVYTEQKKIADLKQKKVTHIADLITQAASYQRAWIPALQRINGVMVFTASVVDRCQGGGDWLKQQGIPRQSLVQINEQFFDHARANKIINQEQLALILNFLVDPDEYAIHFLEKNKNFLRHSLNSNDAGIRKKAERCRTENPYQLDFSKYLND